MASIGGNRYKRINSPSLAAGQGGSSAPMPVFGKASAGITQRPGGNGGFEKLIGLGESMYGNKLANDRTAKMEALYQKQKVVVVVALT